MTIGLRAAFAVLALTSIGSGTSAARSVGAAATSLPCTPAQAASFAWWPGTWDYASQGREPGVTTVTVSNSGCQFQAELVDAKKQQTSTTIIFDPGSQRWKRLVADPTRTYRSSGVYAPDGSISFYESPTARETYRPTDHDHVRYFGEFSKDGGKSWKIVFDASFTRRP